MNFVEYYHSRPKYRLDKVFYTIFEKRFKDVSGNKNVRIISGWGINPFVVRRSDPSGMGPTIIEIHKRVRGTTIKLHHTIVRGVGTKLHFVAVNGWKLRINSTIPSVYNEEEAARNAIKQFLLIEEAIMKAR